MSLLALRDSERESWGRERALLSHFVSGEVAITVVLSGRCSPSPSTECMMALVSFSFKEGSRVLAIYLLVPMRVFMVTLKNTFWIFYSIVFIVGAKGVRHSLPC